MKHWKQEWKIEAIVAKTLRGGTREKTLGTSYEPEANLHSSPRKRVL